MWTPLPKMRCKSPPAVKKIGKICVKRAASAVGGYSARHLGNKKARITAGLACYSSRYTFSRRSCISWASRESVAIGRASSRAIPIGSPVSSQ